MRLYLRTVSSRFIILSTSGIKDMHTGIKDMHRPVSMAASVATGIKSVCYRCLVCKADQRGVLLSDLQAGFIY